MSQVPDSVISSVRTIPKDAQVVAAILKEMDINDYEPRVLNQLLEYTNRYASNIIEEAQTYANHAGRTKTIDTRDVDLAIRLQHEKNFSSVPDRELTVEMARCRNSVSLPLIKASAGLRLPPDRYSLTACNYRLKLSSKKPRTVHTVSRLTMASLAANSAGKGSPSVGNVNKGGPMPTFSPKTNPPLSIPVVTKTTTNVSKPSIVPQVKFPEGNKLIPGTPPMSVAPATSQMESLPHIMIPTVGTMGVADLKLPTETMQVKRKLEDDDYDVK